MRLTGMATILAVTDWKNVSFAIKISIHMHNAVEKRIIAAISAIRKQNLSFLFPTELLDPCKNLTCPGWT